MCGHFTLGPGPFSAMLHWSRRFGKPGGRRSHIGDRHAFARSVTKSRTINDPNVARWSPAIHSLVDSADEILLLIGNFRGLCWPDAGHPLGHGTLRDAFIDERRDFVRMKRSSSKHPDRTRSLRHA